MRYEIDEVIKNKLLKLWIKDSPGYKKKKTISNIFFAISALIFVGFILFLIIIGSETGLTGNIILLGAGMGFIFGIFPFMIGHSIGYNAKVEYGYPFKNWLWLKKRHNAKVKCMYTFGERTQEVLYVFDEGIEFMYHDFDSDNINSLAVYRIPVENIFGVGYDPKYGMVTIIGKGSLTFYDDYFSREINYRIKPRNIYNDSAYTFILGREDRDKIVEKIMDVAIKGGNYVTLSNKVIVETCI